MILTSQLILIHSMVRFSDGPTNTIPAVRQTVRMSLGYTTSGVQSEIARSKHRTQGVLENKVHTVANRKLHWKSMIKFFDN
jgi:hypothetical protein